jgi:hypothetical protein
MSAMNASWTRAAFFEDAGPDGETVEKIYGPERIKHLARLTNLYPT